MTFQEFLDIPARSDVLSAEIKALIDGKAKPPKSLGRIEELAVQIGLIQQRLQPHVNQPALIVFAGDHGMTRSGVAAFPASVTVSMVDTLLAGKATANAFARIVGADVHVVDAGVARDLTDRPNLVHAKVAFGTQDASCEPAMIPDQAQTALFTGAEVTGSIIAKGADLIALGEMGIGNSSSAALLIHRLTGAPLKACIGPGAGHSQEGMTIKHAVLAKAAARSDASAPLDVLVQFGGYEIAMMAGAVIECARQRVPVLIDGFISSAAALLAIRLAPASRDFCIFTHASAEPGHSVLMNTLQATPLLSLDMRLGEGTGALLAVPMIRAACAITSELASLEEVLEATT